MLMQKPNKRGFVWAFLADKMIAYRFAGRRSGETPAVVARRHSRRGHVHRVNKVTGTARLSRETFFALIAVLQFFWTSEL